MSLLELENHVKPSRMSRQPSLCDIGVYTYREMIMSGHRPASNGFLDDVGDGSLWRRRWVRRTAQGTGSVTTDHDGGRSDGDLHNYGNGDPAAVRAQGPRGGDSIAHQRRAGLRGADRRVCCLDPTGELLAYAEMLTTRATASTVPVRTRV